MTSYQIDNADITQWLPAYQGERFHAALFDPPYALLENAKRFSSPDAATPDESYAGGAFTRQAKGFMGQTWDGFESLADYQRWVTQWAKESTRVMYPGALGAAFGGSRTWHRLAVGLEDAGLEIVDTIIWAYGSGMPKSFNVGRGMDKRAGFTPDKRKELLADGRESTRRATSVAHGDYGDKSETYEDVYFTPEGQRWSGHGTQLKPGYEPVIIFRVPRGKLGFIDLARQYGTGALNIDAARIPLAESDEAGRFPSNVVLTHSPDCDPSGCVEGCPVREIDEQSGELHGAGNLTGQVVGKGKRKVYDGGFSQDDIATNIYPDSGGASRFFYSGKAATWERHLPGYLSPSDDLTPSQRAEVLADMHQITPMFGSTDIYPAAWVPARLAGNFEPARCTHPTVKPIELTAYLAKLLLPPDGQERRLLIPFSGVGSEMIGGALAGWEFVQGVELTPDYIPQALSRLEWWSRYPDYESAQIAYNQKKDAARERKAQDKARDRVGVRQVPLIPDME